MASFMTGVLFVLFAEASPVHELSDDYLFSVHMSQHTILILVIPFLLLIGFPG